MKRFNKVCWFNKASRLFIFSECHLYCLLKYEIIATFFLAHQQWNYWAASYSTERGFSLSVQRMIFHWEVHSQIHFKRGWIGFNSISQIEFCPRVRKYTTMRNSLSVGRVFVLRENQLMKQIYWISRHFPQYRGSLHIANFDFWKKMRYLP